MGLSVYTHPTPNTPTFTQPLGFRYARNKPVYTQTLSRY